MSTLREFFQVFRLYNRHHSTAYALRTAWRIAVLKWSF
jgi:hypothetical protein